MGMKARGKAQSMTRKAETTRLITNLARDGYKKQTNALRYIMEGRWLRDILLVLGRCGKRAQSGQARRDAPVQLMRENVSNGRVDDVG